MSRSQGNRGLNVTMSDDELKTVHRIARDRGYSVTSDYVRSLIETDINAHGEDFRFKVNRGGYRERKPDTR